MAKVICKKTGFNSYLVFIETDDGKFKPLDTLSFWKKRELEQRAEGLSNSDIKTFVKIYRKSLMKKLRRVR